MQSVQRVQPMQRVQPVQSVQSVQRVQFVQPAASSAADAVSVSRCCTSASYSSREIITVLATWFISAPHQTLYDNIAIVQHVCLRFCLNPFSFLFLCQPLLQGRVVGGDGEGFRS